MHYLMMDEKMFSKLADMNSIQIVNVHHKNKSPILTQVKTPDHGAMNFTIFTKVLLLIIDMLLVCLLDC